MCGTCGCSPGNQVTMQQPGHHHHHHDGHEHHHDHHHDHDHHHHHAADHDHHSHDHDHHHHGHSHDHHHHDGHSHHGHSHEPGKASSTIQLEIDILDANNRMAERNRGWFEARQVLAINLVSSPGSGKTTLLEQTLSDLMPQQACYVIEGDQQTMQDANRIAETGAPVIQINTGKGCHLDATMINQAVRKLQPAEHAILFIENVGNLVCPAMFDLGEQVRVVIASVTEGEDKPLKYPDMFLTSQLCIINKTDLLPYVPFSVEQFMAYAKSINPSLQFITLSALKRDGLNTWYQWLEQQVASIQTIA